METYLYEDSPFVFVLVTLLMGGWLLLQGFEAYA